jgi:hypothetical protein
MLYQLQKMKLIGLMLALKRRPSDLEHHLVVNQMTDLDLITNVKAKMRSMDLEERRSIPRAEILWVPLA